MEAAGLEEEHETETAISGDEALSEADLDRTKEMAARSLTMDESLITETLAKVYEIQGKQEKAIEIYQKLILKIPERSTYFSARIKKLKGS
jgi:Tfp pilus assembly protein FimV